MDINSLSGSLVIYDSATNGYGQDQDLAKKYLTIGGIYTVLETHIHRSYTIVYFKEVPQVGFNSVLFGDLSPFINTLQAIVNDCNDYINDEDGPDAVTTMIAMRNVARNALKVVDI